MAFRTRMFRANRHRNVLRRQTVKDTDGKDVDVQDADAAFEIHRQIDQDLTTREKAQRFARRTARFCRS